MKTTSRVSILHQIYTEQINAVAEQQVTKKEKIWHRNFRSFLLWMLIGILLGGIPLAVVVTLYTTQRSNHTSSTKTSVPSLQWSNTGITVAGISNVAGIGNNQLNTPKDVILDYLNTLYIADTNNHRVQKYLMGATSATTIAGGTNGASSNQLQYPSRILFDSNGGLFVADSGNNRIQFWSNGASTGSTIAGITGISGTSNNLLNNPFGIARNPNSGALYIADYANNRLMQYLSGASSSYFNNTGFGTSDTQLWKPAGVYFDSSSNSLIIANSNAENIVRLVLGASHWTLLAGSADGTGGQNSTLLNYPVDATLDPMGSMYVADRNNHRIQFFMLGQTEGITVAGTSGVPGNNSTLLNNPYAVRLDSQLNMYVADSYNHRIQKFPRY